ncbi:MAG: hypothetical protein J0L82_17605 [Deltaproteobacteria bacterium]|jgi:hypothetical protein|nr:hypothetical protein [Deltaproteobacteria bacterium]
MKSILTLLIFTIAILFQPTESFAFDGSQDQQIESMLQYSSSDLNPAMESEVFKSTPKTSYSCCKVCTKGKACGDSCISRYKTCTKGVGCACDG